MMFALAMVTFLALQESDPRRSAGAAPEPASCELQAPPCGWAHGPLGEDLFTYGVARTRETDSGGATLRGITLSAGPYGGEPNEFWGSAFVGIWLSMQEGADLEVYGMGMEFCPELPLGPVRVAPRFKLGTEYRTGPPHEGLGGVAAVGAELGVWLGRRVELVVAGDREFGFPSGTSNRAQLLVRFGGPKKTWWPKWWPFGGYASARGGN